MGKFNTDDRVQQISTGRRGQILYGSHVVFDDGCMYDVVEDDMKPEDPVTLEELYTLLMQVVRDVEDLKQWAGR